MSRSELGIGGPVEDGANAPSVGQFNPRQDTKGNRSSSQPACSADERVPMEGADVTYIGQYEKVSKWIPRTSSAYGQDPAQVRGRE